MRHYPNMEDEWDKKALEELHAEPWMLEMLKKNPSYVHWGNHEDYMIEEKQYPHSWRNPVEIQSVSELLESWTLDDYNEVVNFYFEVSRDGEACKTCQQEYYNKATLALKKSFRGFDQPNGGWRNHLTDDEVEFLAKRSRLGQFLGGIYRYNEQGECWEILKDSIWKACEPPTLPSTETVNAAILGGKLLSGGSISLIEHRAKRLGIFGWCETCGGKGYIYTADKATLNLQMWVLHPRKGASRGVYVKNIQQDEVPQIIDFLKQAWGRNNERFSRLDDETMATHLLSSTKDLKPGEMRMIDLNKGTDVVVPSTKAKKKRKDDVADETQVFKTAIKQIISSITNTHLGISENEVSGMILNSAMKMFDLPDAKGNPLMAKPPHISHKEWEKQKEKMVLEFMKGMDLPAPPPKLTVIDGKKSTTQEETDAETTT